MEAGASLVSHSYSDSQVRNIMGDSFDQVKFDKFRSEDGTLSKKNLMKIWMPHPGIGSTKSTYSVEYSRQPDFGYEEFLRIHLKMWCESFWGDENFGSRMWGGEHTAISMCLTMFGSWPRGHGPGQLLSEPFNDNRPVQERGISKEWLSAVWEWNETYMWWTPQTRVWISCFVKPITAAFGCSLYDFVPLEYRQPPDCFLSHSWDLALHCIFKAAAGDWNATSYWIDGFAINQHAYGDDIGKIGEIVNSISNTVVILRGEGPPSENLRCMYRSWCIYEITHTPDGCLKCAITAQNGNHEEYSEAVRAVDIQQAEATFPEDKEMIDKLVLDRFSDFEVANDIVRKCMLKGYYDFFCAGHGFGTPFTEPAMQAGRAFAESYYR